MKRLFIFRQLLSRPRQQILLKAAPQLLISKKYPVAHAPQDIFYLLIIVGPPLGVFAGEVGTGVVGI